MHQRQILQTVKTVEAKKRGKKENLLLVKFMICNSIKKFLSMNNIKLDKNMPKEYLGMSQNTNNSAVLLHFLQL
jgi:hypothetical protein